MRARTLIGAAAVLMLLAGCAEAQSAAVEQSASSEPAVSAPAVSEAADSDPNSAEGRRSAFQDVLTEVDSSQEVPNGDAAIAALEAAGFARADMERTSDLDSLGQPVTLIEIAVRIGESCLVGQIGQGEPEAQILPVMSSGTCLIGETVPVD